MSLSRPSQAFQPLSVSSEQIDLYALADMKEGGVGLGGSGKGLNKYLEPSWPYLKIIYEVFLKYVNRMKGAILKVRNDTRDEATSTS